MGVARNSSVPFAVQQEGRKPNARLHNLVACRNCISGYLRTAQILRLLVAAVFASLPFVVSFYVSAQKTFWLLWLSPAYGHDPQHGRDPNPS
jgi:hypothetical protein